MPLTTFDQFFALATTSEHAPGGMRPFDYQRRLACGECGDRSQAAWLSGGADCRSLLIDVPTGCGKTAAVVMAWLWNRVHLQRADWPRRLVYCLPMRTLVEQTRDTVGHWLEALVSVNRLGVKPQEDLAWLRKNSPIALMGGEDAGPDQEQWDIWPEKPAIIIGTQDMLLSRALNRGYGMSRCRWPMHFGLLNNDCLWVFDEVQLMGAGLPTTSQLEAFRTLMKPERKCYSIWMSATVRRDWLGTVDFDSTGLGDPISLSERDESQLEAKLSASKPLEPLGVTTTVSHLADRIITEAGRSTGLTLVVVNTVGRARGLHQVIENRLPQDRSDLKPTLIHSRFRPRERSDKLATLRQAEGRPGIVVSTQVVEAGVDVSATVLFTELAPWASVVQRCGRCNRRGRDSDARIFWIDLDGDKELLPYEADDLERSRERLRGLSDAGLNRLRDVRLTEQDHPRSTHVLRRKDMVDLFDSTPDLAGNHIDIDRYVRDAEDRSVQVFWRLWEGGGAPPAKTPAAHRNELCPAPIGEFREFTKERAGKHQVWRWGYLDRKWDVVGTDSIVPGQMYLVHSSAGGYSTEVGWSVASPDFVEPATVPEDGATEEGNDDDPLSTMGSWQSIAGHTDDVYSELSSLIEALAPVDANALRVAARWHDWGKAHEIFQAAVRDACDGQERPSLWRKRSDVAKTPQTKKGARASGWWERYRRTGFRHELASALAMLQPSVQLPEEERDLAAYLVAAHHGKVRLSIRSLPNEKRPANGGRFARGIWDGDSLAEVDLGDGVVAPAVTLSLEPIELGLCQDPPFAGQRSWADRALRLRDDLGPFRLAFLETLLRAADERASARATDVGRA